MRCLCMYEHYNLVQLPVRLCAHARRNGPLISTPQVLGSRRVKRIAEIASDPEKSSGTRVSVGKCARVLPE